MADADAEAAFLRSMQAMNEGVGDYKATGGVSEQHIDSSSDEYDPSHEVQEVSMSFGPQDPSDHVSSLGSLKNDVLRPLSTSPQIPVSASSAPSGTDTSATITTIQSQPYSTASLPSTNVQSPSETLQDSHMFAADSAERKESHSDVNGVHNANGGPRGQALRSGSSTSLKNTSFADVSVQNATHSQNHSDVNQQRSAVDTVPNLAAVIPDTGARHHDSNLDKPTETLLAPQLQMSESSTANTTLPPTSTAPKVRLPHDKLGILEDRIKEDERGDLDAWQNLINEHRKRGKLDDARKVYERFLALFPTAAEQWVAYAQMENDAQNRNAVETIFNNTLLLIPNIQLWSMYLDHIRRHNNTTTDTSGSARQIIYQAYELALKHIGLDKESGKIWQDYIQFIKSGPGNIGGSNWQDQQKMDLLRKAYQRAICVPTQAVNSLWKEYDGFEMGLNKMTGRKFLQDQSPGYMSARSSYTELQNITRELKRTSIPVLPPALGFDGDVEYMKQLEIWKRWIQWEKDDPLVLKLEDLPAYRDRIVFVYKQALMAMRFWPEMWFDAAEFCFQNELENDGNEFLSQGIVAIPESCLLAFKRADRLELSTTNEEGDENIKRRGAAVREPYDKVLDALYGLITKATTREARELARIEVEFSETTNDQPNGTEKDDDAELDNEESDSPEKRKKTQIEALKNINAMQIRLLQKSISHTWIALMRAMRRVQGKGKVNDPIGGSRQIFTDARKRGRITSDVWIAAALLEFHCYEAEAAKRIFERGVKLFPEDESFALEYIKHLIANNDHTNARVIFETAVGRLVQKPENIPKTKSLYAFFHDFESRYGELSQIVKLEKRMEDLFPEDSKLVLFSQRFTQEGFDPTAIRHIISPATQARPKVVSRIESPPSAQQTPPSRFAQTAPSPKRPMPFEESDAEVGRPRKLHRGESPLKGAAGRRLDQQKRNRQPHESGQLEGHGLPQVPPPPPLPRDVLFLLSIIPKAQTYHATRFKAEGMVRLIRDTNIPSSVHQLRPPPGGTAIQQMPPMPPMPPMPQMPQMPHGQYNGQYSFNR